jgi:hypothetical protein
MIGFRKVDEARNVLRWIEVITEAPQPLAAPGNFSIALFQCCGFDTNRWTKFGKCPIHEHVGFPLAGGHGPVP